MSTTADLVCPKCQGRMRTYERSGVTVDQCTECRGIFLDRGELERLVDAEQGWQRSHPAPRERDHEYERDRDRNRGPRFPNPFGVGLEVAGGGVEGLADGPAVDGAEEGVAGAGGVEQVGAEHLALAVEGRLGQLGDVEHRDAVGGQLGPVQAGEQQGPEPEQVAQGPVEGGRGLGRGQPRDDHPGVGGHLGQARDQQPQLAPGLTEGGAVGHVVGAHADQHDVRVQALHLGELVDDDVVEPGAGDAKGVQADPVLVAQGLGHPVGEGVLGGVGADPGDRAVAEDHQRKRFAVLRADRAADLQRLLMGEETMPPGRHHLGGQRRRQSARTEQGRPTDLPDSDAQPRLLVRGSAYGLLTGL
jgi:uncharacterized protein